jgi:hypothetical protein
LVSSAFFSRHRCWAASVDCNFSANLLVQFFRHATPFLARAFSDRLWRHVAVPGCEHRGFATITRAGFATSGLVSREYGIQSPLPDHEGQARRTSRLLASAIRSSWRHALGSRHGQEAKKHRYGRVCMHGLQLVLVRWSSTSHKGPV